MHAIGNVLLHGGTHTRTRTRTQLFPKSPAPPGPTLGYAGAVACIGLFITITVTVTGTHELGLTMHVRKLYATLCVWAGRDSVPTPPPSPPTPPMHLGGLQRSPCSRLAMSHKCRIRRQNSLIRPPLPPPPISGPRGAYQADTTLIQRISNVPDISVIHQPDTRPVQQRTEASSSAPKLPAPVGVEVAWNGCQPAPGPQ